MRPVGYAHGCANRAVSHYSNWLQLSHRFHTTHGRGYRPNVQADNEPYCIFTGQAYFSEFSSSHVFRMVQRPRGKLVAGQSTHYSRTMWLIICLADPQLHEIGGKVEAKSNEKYDERSGHWPSHRGHNLRSA